MISQKYPLKVYYPQGGIHYLLHWWDRSNQNQLILARSSQAIETTAARLFEVINEIQIKQYLRIEIVTPSLEMSTRVSSALYQQEVENFLEEVTFHLKEAISIMMELPAIFDLCTSYLPRKEAALDPEEIVEFSQISSVMYHYYCQNCCHGLKLKSLTQEQFHTKFSDKWRKLHPQLKNNSIQPTLSRAVPVQADEDCRLQVAIRFFGHQEKGIWLTALGSESLRILLSYPNNILFFFRVHEELDFSQLEKLQQSISSKIFNEENLFEKERMLHFEAEKLAMVREDLACFQD